MARTAVGVDMEDTKRFMLKNGKTPPFFKKLFTSRETSYCLGKRFPEQHFAARFAAKEAVIKAIAGLGLKKPAYHDIEVGKRRDGVPVVRMANVDISLSMSHTTKTAVAFVLAQKK